MLKRCLSLLLLLSLVLSLCSFASASNAQYDNKVQVIGMNPYPTKIYSKTTQFDEIKEAEDGTFAMEIETAQGVAYIPVGKYEFNVANYTEVMSVLERDDISDDVKKGIEEKYQEAVSVGAEIVIATIYSQDLLNQDGESEENSVSLFSQYDFPQYVTWNGHEMKNDFVSYTGMSSGFVNVAKDSAASRAAAAIKTVAIIVGTAVSKELAILSTGIELFKAFCNLFGISAVPGTVGDYLQVCITHNDLHRYVYGKVGNDWYLGLLCKEITITRIQSKQHYYINTTTAKDYDSDRYVTQIIESENYSNAYPKAWACIYNPYVDYMSVKCGDIQFAF